MLQDRLSAGLFMDLYELTMAQGYWQSNKTDEATFSLFFRNYPPNRGYFVFSGLQDVLNYLESFHFTNDDIKYLDSLDQFNGDFLEYLGGMRFTGSVRAMPEGSIFFINEPVIEVTAPVIEAQIIETVLINEVNLQTILATKASRVLHAARGRTLVDFAARRTHGIDAANKLARTSYMTGFAGTSNVLAGGLYGIPTFGTMAHSFIACFEDEAEAFRAYARSFPDNSTFLVDTYDTLDGVGNAIVVAKEMKQQGHNLRSVRLDSGDFLELSVRARPMLDEAGLEDVQIVASGGLDEFAVDELLESGAQIDAFGIGTKVGVSADAPWTDCAYKLVQYGGNPVMKLSTDKKTLPDPKQVYRFRDDNGCYLRDVIARADEKPVSDEAQPLLSEVMKNGKTSVSLPSLNALRQRFAEEFASLPDEHKALRSPKRYKVVTSDALLDLQAEVARHIQEHSRNL